MTDSTSTIPAPAKPKKRIRKAAAPAPALSAAEQYRAIKAKSPGYLILFRMGDFYEAFFDDAATVARVCGFKLTTGNGGEPMAGVPYFTVEQSLRKLIAAGHKVALAELAAGGKGDREVVPCPAPEAQADPVKPKKRARKVAAPAAKVEGGDVRILLDPNDVRDYETFLKVKALPRYRFQGRTAVIPREYAARLGLAPAAVDGGGYEPWPGLFDYQRDIAALAIRKGKFAVFADCGLGKTLILLEFARQAAARLPAGRCVLIVSPLMVVKQTLAEAAKFYGDTLPVERVAARDLASWLVSGSARVGITNYDALDETIPAGRLGALILDESSMLKSAYGKWGRECVRLGKGLDWKLALTGTPAPNDRIEYANHAVFLDAFPTVNSFLSRFFVNRGQTDNRWELKPHALRPFYNALSDWCIFLTNPATYGWSDNAANIPPIRVHVHEVSLTGGQRDAVMTETGRLFASAGGIASRSRLGQIAKGNSRGGAVETLKPAFIRQLVESWPEESTIIWCLYNAEQDRIAAEFPDAANVAGDTPMEERERLIDDFKAGRRRQLISKGKILGFGLNLQTCTRMVFSGIQDSYETYYQCVKRANRVGSTLPLNVHIPVTEIERPMMETVLRKAARVQQDTEEQENLFKEVFNATL